jgi:integrase
MECLRLRVKDIDFGYARITVRDGKGGKDRVTMLPINLAAALQRHLLKIKAQFEEDLDGWCRRSAFALRPRKKIS